MTEQEHTEPKRKMFFVVVSFLQPNSGTFPVAARDKDHAREVAMQMLSNVQDGQIIDVYSEDEMAKLQEEAEAVKPEMLN